MVTFIKSLETLMNAGFLLSFSQKCPRKCPQRSEVTPSTRARGWAKARSPDSTEVMGRHARAGSAMAAAKSRVRPVSINSMALPQTFRHRIRNRHPLRHGEGRLQRQVAQVQEVDARQHRRAAGRKNLRTIV